MPVGACLRVEGASSMRSAPTSADCRQMRRFPSRREDPGMPVGAYQAPTENAYLACKCRVWQVSPIDVACWRVGQFALTVLLALFAPAFYPVRSV